MVERTRYQQKVIKNYYDNIDAISLQKLGELVTDLYLAEGKAKDRLWARVQTTLEKIKLPASRIEHLMQKKDPALLAKLVEELLAKG